MITCRIDPGDGLTWLSAKDVEKYQLYTDTAGDVYFATFDTLVCLNKPGRSVTGRLTSTLPLKRLPAGTVVTLTQHNDPVSTNVQNNS